VSGKKAADDDFNILDIENALLPGKIVKRYANDPKGIRYKVSGDACDYIRRIAIVGRFRGDQLFRIITVYEEK